MMQAKDDSAVDIAPLDITGVTHQMQMVQLNAQISLRSLGKFGAPDFASDQITSTVQALARKFVKTRPGATPQEFVQELRRGRAPSAGLPHDANPALQRKLADILVEDPSLLDFI